MENNTLKHYGVLGMKWGVRRYQNPDGTLTDAGKKRYGSDDGSDDGSGRGSASSMSDAELQSKVKRLNLEKQYTKLSKEKSSSPKLESAKTLVDATNNVVAQAKKISRRLDNGKKSASKMDLSNMSDDELRRRINRYNLEKNYRSIFDNDQPQVSKGRAFVDDALEIGGSLLAIGSSAVAIALALKQAKN